MLRDSTGAAQDLTGATARLHLRTADDTLIGEATQANGRIGITPAAGRIDMIFEAAFMRALALDTYLYDLEVTLPDGRVLTVEQGRLAVMRDITHDG